MLLQQGRFEGSYYLSGYAVECGLKACVAKLTKRYDFPDKDFAREVYTHKLDDLLRIAGLESARDAEFQRDRDFLSNWGVVKDWREQSRYERPGQQQASDLFKAVADRRHGVLRWIKRHW